MLQTLYFLYRFGKSFNFFTVVAINHDGDFVSVYDPSSGDYIASKRDFYAMWEFASGGFALVVLPSNYKHRYFDIGLPPSLFFAK